MSKEHYLKLKDDLIKAAEDYYYGMNPSMTDALYDEMYRELQAIEQQHPEWITSSSPSQSAGANITVSKGFRKVKHSYPMLSLKTETDFTELGASNFDDRINEELATIIKRPDYYANFNSSLFADYYAEPKFDGLGIDLQYFNGKLIQALTRGDGETGEDVTANIRMINDVPKILNIIENTPQPKRLVVRGEVLMFKEVFKQLNELRRSLDQKEYVNTRNAAAGAVRQLDPNKTRERKLNFFAYSLIEITGYNEITINHSEQLELLKQLGFPICDLNKRIVAWEDSAVDLMQYHKHIGEIRKDLPYDIDGVVYKVDNLRLQRYIGYAGREPKWAVAHKFPAEERETLLIGIDVQVGRTGKLTPVARLNPVFVGGVTVTNVTLHNENEILKKNVRVGDMVLVRRAGDVIPEIVGPFNPRPESERYPMFKMPTKCPACGSPTHKEEDEADYRCTGSLFCPAQRKQTLIHFVQRGAVEVNGLGESLIDRLMEKGYLTTVSDLYCLGLRNIANQEGMTLEGCILVVKKPERDLIAVKTLIEVDRISSVSANNVLNAIEASKKTTLQKFLYGLGIRHAGEGTAKRLVKHYKTLDNLIKTTKEELLSIRDIGPTVADSVFTFFNNSHNLEIIKELKLLGVHWDEEVESTPNDYCNKNIVITGTLTSLTRQQLKDRLEVLGANVQSSVGKSTDILIAGPGAGSKLKDANALGIKVIDEQTFIDSVKNLEFFHF